MIFGEASVVNEVGGWVGMAGGGISLLSMVASGWFSYVAARDKLKHDAAVVELRAENRRLTLAEQECRQDHTELRAEVAKLAAKLDAERERSAEERHKLETEIGKQRDTRHELNGRLMQLQAQLGLQGVNVDIAPIKGSSGVVVKPVPPPPPEEPF